MCPCNITVSANYILRMLIQCSAVCAVSFVTSSWQLTADETITTKKWPDTWKTTSVRNLNDWKYHRWRIPSSHDRGDTFGFVFEGRGMDDVSVTSNVTKAINQFQESGREVKIYQRRSSGTGLIYLLEDLDYLLVDITGGYITKQGDSVSMPAEVAPNTRCVLVYQRSRTCSLLGPKNAVDQHVNAFRDVFELTANEEKPTSLKDVRSAEVGSGLRRMMRHNTTEQRMEVSGAQQTINGDYREGLHSNISIDYLNIFARPGGWSLSTGDAAASRNSVSGQTMTPPGFAVWKPEDVKLTDGEFQTWAEAARAVTSRHLSGEKDAIVSEWVNGIKAILKKGRELPVDDADTLGTINFVLTYRGDLSDAHVTKEAAHSHAILRYCGKTVREFSVPSLLGRPSEVNPKQTPNPYSCNLTKGDVMVIGWMNLADPHAGWLAVDTDGNVEPRYQFLTSSGETGVLDSAKSDAIERITDIDGERIRLQVATDGKVLRWYADSLIRSRTNGI